MVDINLIPAALRKDGKDSTSLSINLPHEVIVGVASGLVLLIVTVHLILGVVWLMGMGQLAGHNVEWQKLLPDKTILDGISSESKDLKRKISMITDMTVNK